MVTFPFSNRSDAVALLVRHQTCNSQVVDSSLGCAPQHSLPEAHGQATYTCHHVA